MVKIVRRVGLAAWGALVLWAAWCFWRELLAGWGLAPRLEVDPGYGVRLTPLRADELAAARALEQAVWSDPDAFAEAPCGC